MQLSGCFLWADKLCQQMMALKKGFYCPVVVTRSRGGCINTKTWHCPQYVFLFDIFGTKLYLLWLTGRVWERGIKGFTKLYSNKCPGRNAGCRHGRRKLGILYGSLELCWFIVWQRAYYSTNRWLQEPFQKAHCRDLVRLSRRKLELCCCFT